MSGPTPSQLAYTGAPVAAFAVAGVVIAAVGGALMRVMKRGAQRGSK